MRLLRLFTGPEDIGRSVWFWLGFALAVASVTLLRRWSPPNLPRLETVSIDWAVLGLAVAVSLGAAMLIDPRA